MTDDVVFKDIRALGATDATRGKSQAHSGSAGARLATTTDIYIKEAIPHASSVDMGLSWR